MNRLSSFSMPRRLFGVTLVFVAVCILSGSVEGKEITAGVRWVVDGDTVILDTGQTVRLMGINAPELSRDDQPGQYFAQQARQKALELMHGHDVQVRTFRTDRFQRLVGTVHLADGTLVNKALVQGGAAFVSVYSDQEQGGIAGLVDVQRQAMGDRVGFWGTILSLSQASGPFVGNRRSKRFHSQDCAFGQAIHDRNRREFLNLEQAFGAGFAPGRCCTPWPTRAEVQQWQGN
ncbi:MAG: thermonuclease family protein [Desulfovermiculus sp.]|nr:thermonuclease family protein [Desulfovermiculus sp.]